MFGFGKSKDLMASKETDLGRALRESSEAPKVEAAKAPEMKAESFDSGKKNLDQLAVQRRESVKAGWESVKGFVSRFAKKSVDVALTAPERAMRGAQAAKETVVSAATATKEGVKQGAEFVSDKTRQVHAAGMERITTAVEAAGQRKDAAVMKLDNGIDAGVKFYEAKKIQFAEWQKTRADAKAEQDRQNLIQQKEALLKQLEAINSKLTA